MSLLATTLRRESHDLRLGRTVKRLGLHRGQLREVLVERATRGDAWMWGHETQFLEGEVLCDVTGEARDMHPLREA